jgi:hypothetical protein
LISQEFVPPKEATYRLHPELTQEFVSAKDFPDRLDVEITEEVELRSSGAMEFRVPNAAEDFMESADRKETVPLRAETPPNAGELKVVTDTKAAPAGQSYAASDTKGQSVASFFKALLAARPPGNSSASPSSSALAKEGTPASGQTKDAAVSFDDFFRSATGDASPLPQKSGDPSNNDLDQFQSWLQNLKH